MKTQKLYKNKEWLREKYIDEGKSTIDIAEICGCAQPTISIWLRKLRIKTRGRGKPKDRVELACEECGAKFRVKRSSSDRKYCSQKCYTKARKVRRVKIDCEYCGKTIEVPEYESGSRRFCSRQCTAKWHGEQMKIWKNKKAYKKAKREAPGDLKKNKKRARERDNHICQFCGKVEKSGKYNYWRLATHHIKPIREGGTNNIGNIITLCSSCHNSLERSKLERKIKPKTS